MHKFLLLTVILGFNSLAGTASWYGEDHRGLLMANGKPFDPDQFTCASWNYPLGTRLKVSHNKRSVIVTVTDRGPALNLRREIDLSLSAFKRLADARLGLIPVSVKPQLLNKPKQLAASRISRAHGNSKTHELTNRQSASAN